MSAAGGAGGAGGAAGPAADRTGGAAAGSSPAGGAKGAAAPKGAVVAPRGVRILTEELLKDAADDGDPASLTEFELIFTPVDRIDNLHLCPKLRTLHLIDTSTKRISGLEPVGRSLLRLLLVEQGLQKIEGLALPNLRELILMDNQITKIEGLTGCPKLQRLWLQNNKLTKIQGLESLGDLRELCLQGNKITELPRLDYLVNLQVLALGANRIADFKDLPNLAPLHMLQSLSFDDVHYGSCPVINADGYRDFVLCTLRQLTELDGEAVEGDDRRAAQDAFLKQALAFSDKVESLCHENEQELLAIEARRQRNWLNAGAMRGELLTAFGELETVVRAGRESVVAEQQRQQRVREANLDALALTLEEARREQAAWVDRRLSAERKAMAAEEAAFAAMIARAEAEAQEAQFLAGLAFRTHGAVVCQELSDHSPDFRFVASHFRESMASVLVRPKGGGAGAGAASGGSGTPTGSEATVRSPLKMLKAFKVFNQDVERAFVSAGDSPETLRLFASGGREELRSVVEKGYTSEGRAGSVALFVDPWHSCVSASGGNADEAVDGGRIHALVLCRVCPGRALPVPAGPTKVPNRSSANDVAGRLPKGYSAACLSHDASDDRDGEEEAGPGAPICYVLPSTEGARVLPEFYILCVETGDGLGRNGADASESALEAALADLTQTGADSATGSAAAQAIFGGVDADGAELLAAFQKRVTEAVARHEERVWRQMDPETARKLQETEGEVKRLTATLHSLREDIDSEKSAQEKVLRDFRNSIAKGRGSRSHQRPGSASRR